MPESDLLALARGARDGILDLARRLVQTPSPTGDEAGVAAVVREAMTALHYDDVRVDEAGSVIGRLAGGSGRTVLLHAHMDTVDAGDPADWTHAPHSGAVANGYLWGRGTCDDKASLAAQVMAVGLLRAAGRIPPGDVYVAAVVGEEIGGFGTRHMLRTWRPEVAVIGEPSGNTLRRGHRGRLEFLVTFHGRSAHASAPERGLNPHFSMARFVLALRREPMAHDAVFGDTTVAPTVAYVDQTSANVIPAEYTVHLDWRSAPADTVAAARALIERLASESAEPGVRAEVRLRTRTARAYTGLEHALEFVMPAFRLADEAPELDIARRAVERALARSAPVGQWAFATDGGHLSAAGVPCIGFGPGDEAMAHVVDERVSIDQMVEATAAYMELALSLGAG